MTPESALDYLPRGPLERLQSRRLRQLVGRVYEHVPLYRHRMHQQGVTPEDISGLDDLDRLPLCTAGDLEAEWPRGLLAVPTGEVARRQAAASPTGQPIAVAFTRDDLAASHEVLVRALACCGLRDGDVLQNVGGYGLFADSLGLHLAAESLGATVIAASPAEGQRHAAAFGRFGVSVIGAAASYFEYLVEQIEREATEPGEPRQRMGIVVDEAWTDALLGRVEATTGMPVRGLASLPEVAGRVVAAQCEQGQGVHILEDHVYPQVVDAATGQTLPDGEEGELVVTTLTRQATPLLRYRTSVRTAIIAGACPCGRTLRRLRGIDRSGAGAFVMQGVRILPSQIEAVLRAVEGELPPYRIARGGDGPDRFELHVEVTPRIFRDKVGAIEGLQRRLAEEIERAVGACLPVRFVEPHAITRRNGA